MFALQNTKEFYDKVQCLRNESKQLLVNRLFMEMFQPFLFQFLKYIDYAV